MKVHKSAFSNSKYPANINEADIKKILIFDEVACGKKGFQYFISYKDGNKITPLCISIPKVSGYVECFDKTKYIPFSIKDEELLDT